MVRTLFLLSAFGVSAAIGWGANAISAITSSGQMAAQETDGAGTSDKTTPQDPQEKESPRTQDGTAEGRKQDQAGSDLQNRIQLSESPSVQNPAEIHLSSAHPEWSHAQLSKVAKCSDCHQSVSVDRVKKTAIVPFKQTGTQTAYLGVIAENIPASLAAHLELPTGSGALVKNVVEESPAYHCGLEKHDVIVRIDQKNVLGKEGLRKLVRERVPGRKVTVEYVRAGKNGSLQLVLGKQLAVDISESVKIAGCHARISPQTNCNSCHVAE